MPNRKDEPPDSPFAGLSLPRLEEFVRDLAANPAGDHLSEDQIVALVAGLPDGVDVPACERHLASCPRCRSEVEALDAALAPWEGADGERREAALADRVLATMESRRQIGRVLQGDFTTRLESDFRRLRRAEGAAAARAVPLAAAGEGSGLDDAVDGGRIRRRLHLDADGQLVVLLASNDAALEGLSVAMTFGTLRVVCTLERVGPNQWLGEARVPRAKWMRLADDAAVHAELAGGGDTTGRFEASGGGAARARSLHAAALPVRPSDQMACGAIWDAFLEKGDLFQVLARGAADGHIASIRTTLADNWGAFVRSEARGVQGRTQWDKVERFLILADIATQVRAAARGAAEARTLPALRQEVERLGWRSAAEARAGWDFVGRVAGLPLRVAKTGRTAVLLVPEGGGEGVVAWLECERLTEAGTGVVFPDPYHNGFLHCGNEFLAALDDAVHCLKAEGVWPQPCPFDVRWRLRRADGWLLQSIDGPSAGLAFGLALASVADLGDHASDLARSLATLDLRSLATTATLAPGGDLGTVHGVFPKLRAAALGPIQMAVVARGQRVDPGLTGSGVGSRAGVLEVLESSSLRDVVSQVRTRTAERAVEKDQWEVLATYARPLLPQELDTLTRDFTGRAWLIDEIDAWLASRDAGNVLWISARPGMGKTALAAWVAANRSEFRAAHLAFGAGKGDARQCVVSLAAALYDSLPEYRALLRAVDLRLVINTMEPAQVFDRLVLRPLSGLAEQSPPIALIIDGLDTMTDTSGRNLLADAVAALEDSAPRWLRVLVTTCPTAEVVGAMPAFTRTRIDIEQHSADNLSDIRTFVRRRLAGRAPAHAEAVVAASEGSFLFATLMVEEMLETGQLESLPQGLSAYYRHAFSRRFGSVADYAARVRPALEVLVAAAEPMPSDLLSAALGWSSYTPSEFTTMMGPFLVIRPEGVHLFHSSLRAWLTDDGVALGYAVSVSGGHRTLSMYGLSRRAGSGVPRYVLRHLPHHLTALARWDEAAGVLADPVFCQAAQDERRRYEWLRLWMSVREHRDPAGAFQAALDEFAGHGRARADVADVAELMGGFLRAMNLAEAARAFVQRAYDLRKEYLAADHPVLARSLFEIGRVQRSAGNYAAAREALAAARVILVAQPHGRWHPLVADVLHQLGEIEHDRSRRKAALELYEEALQIRQRVLAPDDPMLADSLHDIGVLHKELGDSERGLPLIRQALAIRQHIPGCELDVASGEFCVAQSLWPVEESRSEAVHRYVRALEIFDRALPPQHQKVRLCQQSLESCLTQRPDLFDVVRRQVGVLTPDGTGRHATRAVVSKCLVRAAAELAKSSEIEAAGQRLQEAVQLLTHASGRLALAVQVNEVARFLQESGCHRAARIFCEHALAIRVSTPDTPPAKLCESHNNLGLTLFNLGEVSEAYRHLQKGVAFDETSPFPHYWLARIYESWDAPGQAAIAWQAYLDLGGPIPERRQEARRRLEEHGARGAG